MDVKTLYPVVLPVPQDRRQLSGRAKVDFLRGFAREAVRRSAVHSGCRLDDLPITDKRVPLPAGGIYWSLSHKSAYVAGVCAAHPIGIDVEKVKPVDERLFHRVLDASEQRLAGAEDANRLFFRCWTAKEVVLKRVGIGLAGLSKCRVQAVTDERRLLVAYEKERFEVAQTFFDGHVAAVLMEAGEAVAWLFDE